MIMNSDSSLDLFVSERDDGIELGGLLGREDPEKNTYRYRDKKAQKYRPKCHGSWEGRDGFDQKRNPVTDQDPDDPSSCRQEYGFGQKLFQDVSRAGTDGFADSDLSCPFFHRYQHDVHHADSPDQQTNR
jgi:hypothetical protein